MHAFRCKNCGRLHPANHAGERHLPTACQVCGKGVTFLSDGTHEYDRDNWEVLADATPERLKELGLESGEVERHTHNSASVEAVYAANLARSQEELALLKAKMQRWETERDKIVAAVHALDDEHARLAALPIDADDHKALGQQHTAMTTNRQKADDLVNQEWTMADEATRQSHVACIARQGRPPDRPPQAFSRGSMDRTKAFERAK